MKTYQEYYNDWQNSTESRDLAFDEWLTMQLARKEKQMVDKACEWLKAYDVTFTETPSMLEDFRRAMEG